MLPTEPSIPDLNSLSPQEATAVLDQFSHAIQWQKVATALLHRLEKPALGLHDIITGLVKLSNEETPSEQERAALAGAPTYLPLNCKSPNPFVAEVSRYLRAALAKTVPPPALSEMLEDAGVHLEPEAQTAPTDAKPAAEPMPMHAPLSAQPPDWRSLFLPTRIHRVPMPDLAKIDGKTAQAILERFHALCESQQIPHEWHFASYHTPITPLQECVEALNSRVSQAKNTKPAPYYEKFVAPFDRETLSQENLQAVCNFDLKVEDPFTAQAIVALRQAILEISKPGRDLAKVNREKKDRGL